MMKAAVLLAVVAMMVPGAALAGAMEDVRAHPACPHCGMDRETFSHSRMLVAYEDGREVGTCSLRCAALELSRDSGRKVRAVRVADHDTRELLDPEAATWVVGGSERGVMTRTPKWAFATRGAADAFVAANGGEVTTYAAVLAAAREELGGGGRAGAQGGKTSGEASGDCSCCDPGK